MKIKFCLLIVLMLSCSCAIKEPRKSIKNEPIWIKNGSDPRFPHSLYISGIGYYEGENNPKTKKFADDLAKKNLAEEIVLNISGTSKDVISSKKITDKNNKSGIIEESESQNITTETSVDIKELEGVTIVDTYYDYDDKIFYSFALLDRNLAKNGLFQKISETIKESNTYYKEAEDSLKKYEFIKAIRFYSNAIRRLKGLDDLLMIYRGISGEILDKNEEITISNIETKIEKILSALSLLVADGDKQMASGGMPLLPITIKAIFKDNVKKEIPVIDLPLNFRIAKGRGIISENGTTDKNGIAKINIFKVETIGIKENIIEIEADFKSLLLDEVTSKPLKINAKYFLPIKEDFRIGIEIIEKNMDNLLRESQIKSNIIEGLKKNGFVLSLNIPKALDAEKIENLHNNEFKEYFKGVCDLLILGNIETKKRGELYGMFFAETWGDVKIINIQDGSIFTAINIQPIGSKGSKGYDTKAGGIDYTSAGLASLTKTGDILSIEIPKILENAINPKY